MIEKSLEEQKLAEPPQEQAFNIDLNSLLQVSLTFDNLKLAIAKMSGMIRN